MQRRGPLEYRVRLYIAMFAMVFWLILTALILSLWSSCRGSSPTSDGSIETLLQDEAARRPSPWGMVSRFRESLTTESPQLDAAERTFASARWQRGDNRYLPFGPNRPLILSGRPIIGRAVTIQYWPFWLRTPADEYDLGKSWIIVSLNPPQDGPQAPLGPGALWFDVRDPSCLVWSFGGRKAYQDAVFFRAENGRVIFGHFAIPNMADLAGTRIWTQMIRLSRNGDWSGSHIYQMTLGEAL